MAPVKTRCLAYGEQLAFTCVLPRQNTLANTGDYSIVGLTPLHLNLLPNPVESFKFADKSFATKSQRSASKFQSQPKSTRSPAKEVRYEKDTASTSASRQKEVVQTAEGCSKFRVVKITLVAESTCQEQQTKKRSLFSQINLF